MRPIACAQSINALNEWRVSIHESRDVAKYWDAFRAGEVDDLDSLDMLRLAQFANSLSTIYEYSYFSWKRDLIGDFEWGRFEVNVCLQYIRVVREPQLVDVFQGALTNEFLGFAAKLCPL